MRKVRHTPTATVRSAYPELDPLFQTRADEEGYTSIGQYFFYLGVYDLILRKPHHVTAYIAHQSPEHQERSIQSVIENFESPHKPGGFLQSRILEAAREETWQLHGQIRELKNRIRELELELERERTQGKL